METKMKQINLVLFFIILTSSLSVASPHFLGAVLTVGQIKNIANYSIKKGELNSSDDSAPFIDGEIKFNKNDLTYDLETDDRGKVIDENQSMSPSNIDEMDSLIKFYSSEGRITRDESSIGIRTIQLY